MKKGDQATNKKSNSRSLKKSSSSHSIKSIKIRENPQNQNKQITLQDLFQQLCRQFSEQNKNRNCLIQYEESLQELEDNMIGKNYIITGPSQCGKLSTVLYALRDKPKISVLVINCDIYSTQNQFIVRLISELQKNSLSNQQQYDKILKRVNNQTINFNELTPMVKNQKSQFVIYLRNAQQLTQCNKQIILYNLLQWMSKQTVKQKIGLVISSRKLALLQKFQKRVRSRFSGRTISIFRLSTPQKIIAIIEKRIEFLIQKKKNKKKHVGKKQEYIDSQYQQFKTIKKRKPLKLANQKLYSTQKQITFLEFIKSGVINNKKLCQYFKQNLNENNNITISFVLRIFQQIFATLDQKQFLNWKVQELEDHISQQFKLQMQYQFPTYNIEYNYLSNLNDTQIMILTLLYSMIKHPPKHQPNKQAPKQVSINLRQIYRSYQSVLHTQVSRYSDGSSQQYPQEIIKRALLRLNTDRIIKFQKYNYDIWNTQIHLLWEARKVKEGIQGIQRSNRLPAILKQIFIKGSYNADS